MQQTHARWPSSLPLRSDALAALRRLRLGVVQQFEAERGRWLLWVPVALGCGAATYFTLPGMPSNLSIAGVGGLALALFALVWRLSGGRPSSRDALLLAVSFFLFGLPLTHLRTEWARAPVLTRAAVFDIEGRVTEVEPRNDGVRVVLDLLTLSRVPEASTPVRLRLNMRRAGHDLVPGDRIQVKARLQPPLAPVFPGGFDFARQAWFDQLGALGYSIGLPKLVSRPASDPWLGISRLRTAIAERITSLVPGPAGQVAAALIAGVRAGIDDATWRAMQISGLAHLISISGLHMALVAGSVFFVCRTALSLVPALALRIAVKRIAAGVALLAAGFYLALAGAPVPAQRSFLTLGIGLLAVVLDRNPFSLRLLSFAATAVLLLAPESVIGASFQLSFAAVLALIAVYDRWGEKIRWLIGPGEPSRALQAITYVLGVATTTLIASFATLPFAAFHFQTIATYGVLANLVAVPLTSFLVMPLGLAAMTLMPFGLDKPLVILMGYAVDAVVRTAEFTSALPGASIPVAQWPSAVLPLVALGGCWMALWSGPWRSLGVAAWLAAGLLIAFEREPDLLVSSDLAQAAVRGPDGDVVLVEWQRDGLIRDAWLRSLGVKEPTAVIGRGGGRAGDVACDRGGCIVQSGSTALVLARSPAAAFEECGRVAVMIARSGPANCPRVYVDPAALRRSGGIALTEEAEGVRIETVRERRGAWPWVDPNSNGLSNFSIKSRKPREQLTRG
ncbi:MAG: ComEC/Rec2 family competence protein [Geminicoccaceae bacterium]